MSPQKEVFKEPIVRAETDRLKFPKLCPVCGAPSEEVMPLTVIPNQFQSLRPSLNYGTTPFGRGQRDSFSPMKKTFYVPVCEGHHYTDEGAGQYRSYCLVFDGLALSYFILASLAFGDELWRGVPVGPWFFFAVGIFVSFLIITYALFRPGPVEDAVKVVGFDGGLRHVWIQFKQEQYRDEFMKENAMTAELVKWVQRA